MALQYTADDVARMLSEINAKLESNTEGLRGVCHRLENLEGRMANMEHLMECMETRMGQMELRINLTDQAVNALAAFMASMTNAAANQHEILKQRLPTPARHRSSEP